MLQKNLSVLLWGPFFVGAPVRPNMPKSTSDKTGNVRGRRGEMVLKRMWTVQVCLRRMLRSGIRGMD